METDINLYIRVKSNSFLPALNSLRIIESIPPPQQAEDLKEKSKIQSLEEYWLDEKNHNEDNKSYTWKGTYKICKE